MLGSLPPSIAILLAMLAPLGAASVAKVAEFPLSDVRLLDSPFKEAMDRNAAYLLSLEPDRLLHNTRLYAGLTPKGELYGGWESKGIAGHTLGHYLTALSQQYAATGDQRFRDKIDYIVSEMAVCQKAYGDGYIGALPPTELATLRAFKDGKVELSGSFNFKNGAWVPWYTEHKVLAGLKDAWVLGGNPQAREVTLKLADWVDSMTSSLTPRQQQQMLQVEQGGMLDTLVELYALTGEKRYLETSRRFYHHAILDPLLAGKDELTGRHANTQIPKIIGEARTYEATGDPDGRKISEFFWDTVVHDRSWVIGGNSNREHFFPIGMAAQNLAPGAAETCNTYNMLKLTEHLFTWEPKPEYADYYERALYNHILASQEPEKGQFAYFMSLKPGHFKTFSTGQDSFWCCVGSGMENHTKYGEAIYFHDRDRLFINLFIPSVLTWKEQGLVLEQHTDYPQKEFTDLEIQAAPAGEISFQIRCPAWTAGSMSFVLNDKPLTVDAAPGHYAEIRRIWKKGDRLRVTIPMKIWTEKLENNSAKVAFLYGPLVLAGDLGPVPRTSTFPYAVDQWDNARAADTKVPFLVGKENQSLTDTVQRVSKNELIFRIPGPAGAGDITLKPFKDIFYDYYNVYWDVLSPKEWETRAAELKATEERSRRQEARLVDAIDFGEQQPEIDHALVSERSKTGDFRDRKWRDASDGGFVEFRMKVLAAVPQVLRCTYWGGDAGSREFQILINGKTLATQKLEHNQPGRFFEVEYPIPASLLAGQDKVTIRFQPLTGKNAGGLFGCAILKSAP